MRLGLSQTLSHQPHQSWSCPCLTNEETGSEREQDLRRVTWPAQGHGQAYPRLPLPLQGALPLEGRPRWVNQPTVALGTVETLWLRVEPVVPLPPPHT